MTVESTPLREQTFRNGPIELSVATGPDVGAPLVLLHGVTRRWQDFDPILPDLMARHRVHAPDLRGHGRSGRAVDGAYRVVDYLPDVVAFLRSLEAPAIVLGHSLGAMLAAAAAAEAPECVRAVVLEDPPFAMMGERLGETMYADLFEGYAPLAGSDRPVDEVAEQLAQVPVGLNPSPQRQRTVRLGEIRDALALRFQASCLKRLDPAVLVPIVARRWLDGLDVAATLGGVACPALLAVGEFRSGGALPHEYAEEIASHLRRATVSRFRGVGHNIHASATAPLLRAVHPFLASLD